MGSSVYIVTINNAGSFLIVVYKAYDSTTRVSPAPGRPPCVPRHTHTMQEAATPTTKQAMSYLLQQKSRWSPFVDVSCRGDDMTMTVQSFEVFVSNPAVVDFIVERTGIPCLLNERVYLDISKEDMQVICNVLRGTEMTERLSCKYYGLFRQLNIGHHWLFDHDCFVRLSNLQRYKYDGEQVSLTDGFPCSFGQDMLHIYKVTGDGFCAKNCGRHVRVTFDIRGHIKEVVDLENDLGGGAGKDSSVGSPVSSDDAAPIKRNPVPRGDSSVDAAEGSGC